MTYAFHPEAEQEFLRAIEYYEECKESLGLDFSTEVHSAIDRIVNFPLAWPSMFPAIRRCLVRRFPYGVVYECSKGKVLILAVMDLRRSPGYWKHRSGK